jgi:hypothetical protein
MTRCKSQSDIATRVARNNPKSPRSLKRAADVYIDANPAIWRMFCALARQDMKNGFKRLSAKYYFEFIRRNAPVRAGGRYKLYNAHSPYFARRFMQENPKARGMFKTAQVKG